MKQTINDFINSIDTKLYSRIRASKGDAECRRYLKEHLAKQCDIHGVVSSACICEENAKGKMISGWCSKHHTDWM